MGWRADVTITREEAYGKILGELYSASNDALTKALDVFFPGFERFNVSGEDPTSKHYVENSEED